MTAHAPAPAERATMDPLDPAKLERERRELERAWSSPPGLWGWLAERSGKRLAIVRLSAAMSLAGFLAFFLSTEFTVLFVAMALMAFFWSAALPLVEGATFAHLGSDGHRYGSIRVWGSVGFIVATVALGHLLESMPVAGLLWVIAAILGAIFMCALAVPEEGVSPAVHAVVSLRATLRRREVQALLGACFLMSAAHGALYVFYSIHLVGLGYGKAFIGWMWTLGVLAEIVVFASMPRLMRRWPARGVLLFAFACAVLRFLLIGWGAESLGLLLAA